MRLMSGPFLHSIRVSAHRDLRMEDKRDGTLTTIVNVAVVAGCTGELKQILISTVFIPVILICNVHNILNQQSGGLTVWQIP